MDPMHFHRDAWRDQISAMNTKITCDRRFASEVVQLMYTTNSHAFRGWPSESLMVESVHWSPTSGEMGRLEVRYDEHRYAAGMLPLANWECLAWFEDRPW